MRRSSSSVALFLSLLAVGCAGTSTGARIGARFVTDAPPPPCVASRRADTTVVPAALVDPKPLLRAGRMVVPEAGLLPEDEFAVILLEFVVNADGSIDSTSIKPLEATHPSLVPTALVSLHVLEFWPGCVRTEAVRTRVVQRFRFGSRDPSYPVAPPLPYAPFSRP